MPHSITHCDACFAYFNKIRGIRSGSQLTRIVFAKIWWLCDNSATTLWYSHYLNLVHYAFTPPPISRLFYRVTEMSSVMIALSGQIGSKHLNDVVFLREARFFLSIQIHLSFAGLLLLFALLNLLQISSYAMLPGSIFVIAMTMVWLYAKTKSNYLFARVLIELAAILIVSAAVFTCLRDYSYDGAHYHLPASIALAEGWNPFDERTGNLWVDHYPHGIWVLRALVDHAASRLDLGRVVNVLLSFSTYWVLLHLVSTRISVQFSIFERAFIFLAAFNPIVVGQLLTNLVDGVLCSLSLSLLFYLMLTQQKQNAFDAALGTVAACILLINTKLTGLMFAFIIISCTLVADWIASGLTARWLNIFLAKILLLLAAGIVSVVVIGYRPYVTNLMDDGVILPSNILHEQIPRKLEEADHLTKLAHGLFGATGANTVSDNVVMKWPGQISVSEIAASTGTARSGGFGPFFGIFLLSSLGCFLAGLWNRDSAGLHGEFIVAAGIVILSCVIFPEPWWARYIPMLPAAVFLILIGIRERVPWFFLAVPLILSIMNIGPFAAKAIWSGYLQTKNFAGNIDLAVQLARQGQVKISQSERSVDYSLYISRVLEERGIKAVYSPCGTEDKPIPFDFAPGLLCLGRVPSPSRLE
jgi:hypothetical protein